MDDWELEIHLRAEHGFQDRFRDLLPSTPKGREKAHDGDHADKLSMGHTHEKKEVPTT